MIEICFAGLESCAGLVVAKLHTTEKLTFI
jgi:hypothetical protein